jgi:hypothetical protein
MGSQQERGGWLPTETRSGAGHEVPAEAPGGPPPESSDVEDVDEPVRDVSHVTLKMAELRRLIHPEPSGR